MLRQRVSFRIETRMWWVYNSYAAMALRRFLGRSFQWHEPLPESVAVWPATGTNCQL